MGMKDGEMNEIDWTAESAVRLVEEYKTHPELWDPKHDMYRVQSSKYEAWSEMARTFQCDIADLRKKLNSIFASHRREKSKIRNGGRSTWFLYPHMNFLPNHIDNNEPVRKSESFEPDSDSSQHLSGDNEDLDDDPPASITIKEEPITEHYIHVEKVVQRPRVKKRRCTRPLLKRKIVKDSPLKDNSSAISSLDSRLLETLRLLRKSDFSKRKDECDSFGEYIATSLRKHDERTQSMIKQAINNILFEQEMKKYNTGQYTVVIGGVDENPLVLGDHDDK